MEQQVKFAATLDSVKANLDKPRASSSTSTRQPAFRFHSSSVSVKGDEKIKQTKSLQPNSSSQEELLKQLREYQKSRN